MPTLIEKGNLLWPDLPAEIPIDYINRWIKDRIKLPVDSKNPFENRTLILEAQTSSGKSTTIPPHMYMLMQTLGETLKKKQVICTQPRIITSASIPEDISKANYFPIKFQMGVNIGYQNSAFSDKPVGENGSGGLIFTTNGVLDVQIRTFTPSNFMKRYSCIIIDEAHERSKQFDATMLAIKQFYLQNADNNNLPFLILMSATFDYEAYAKFLNVDMNNVIRVKGFSFTITDNYLENPTTNFTSEANTLIREIIEKDLKQLILNNPKDKNLISENKILFFVPGNAEIVKMNSLLHDLKVGSFTKVNGIDVHIQLEVLDLSGKAVKEQSVSYRKVMGGDPNIDHTDLNEPTSVDKDDLEILNNIDSMINKKPILKSGYLSNDVSRLISQYEIIDLEEKIGNFEIKLGEESDNEIKIGEEESDNEIETNEIKTGNAEPKYRYKNQIIVSTNVAETGVTLPDLTYVIDCGWSKETEFNPKTGFTYMLLTKPAAQSQIRQRRGRCGRRKAGDFYALYTKDTYDKLDIIQLPQIIKSDATSIIILLIKLLGKFPSYDKLNKYLLDSPSQYSIQYSLTKLQVLGFITEDYAITETGNIASKITTLEIEDIGMILFGFVADVCIDDLIIIALMSKYISTTDNHPLGWSTEESEKIEKNKDKKRKNKRYPANIEWSTIITVAFNLKNIDTDYAYYRFRLLTCDDLFLGYAIFKAFYNIWEKSFDPENNIIHNHQRIKFIKDWCNLAWIRYDKMVNIWAEYEDILNELVVANVDITFNKDKSLSTTRFMKLTHPLQFEENPMNPILKIKQCIYHGYQLNEAIWNEKQGKYEVTWSLLDDDKSKLMIDWNFFEDGQDWSKFDADKKYRPKQILYRKIDMGQYNREKNIYSPKFVNISIMSGF